jgi:hypothetical protein
MIDNVNYSLYGLLGMFVNLTAGIRISIVGVKFHCKSLDIYKFNHYLLLTNVSEVLKEKE